MGASVSAWAKTFGSSWGNSWGPYLVIVIKADEEAAAKIVKSRREAERLRQQILQEDNDVIAVVIAALNAGVLD
jgi:hypothetical protein